MNARSHTIRLKLQQREVYEAVNGLLHTILFFRSSAAGLCRTTVYSDDTKTTNFDYVKCESIKFQHVQLRSIELENYIREKTNRFIEDLNQSDMQRGYLRLEFYEDTTDMFIPFAQTWEVWNIEVSLFKVRCERDRIDHVEQLRDALTDAVLLMSTTVNSTPYAPLASSLDDIARIYETSFSGAQPYHFKISHGIAIQGRRSSVLTDLVKWVSRGAFWY